MTQRMEQRFSLRRTIIFLVFILTLVVAALVMSSTYDVHQGFVRINQVHVIMGSEGHYLSLPAELMEAGVYNNGSFSNEAGVVPVYWEGRANQTSHERQPTYGPCYAYTHQKVDWKEAIVKYNSTGEPWYNQEQITKFNNVNLEGYCRPGFLIIGAGKCGTSSLYHYISSHPKVLPASQKQIHYFKYHTHEPLKWYYQHFPSTSSFLAAGALLTGEASPGYLPYPDVVIDMEKTMPEPRLLVIGRNPIERSYSSYKYNYVDPHIKYLMTGREEGIPRRQPQEFYKQYLYSFEDMMRAELAILKECFARGSIAQNSTRQAWAPRAEWIQDEYKRRDREGLPPLLDLDGYCYGGKVNETVLRKQWTDMVAEQPDKVILNRNVFLVQALIGRSLYLFPLEWWYAAFDASHIYFVCTEELEDLTGESMNQVGEFLGLPRYENFSNVVQTGAYNVGGHRGYDYEIPWSELNEEQKDDDIPLSAEFRAELEEFIRPYNERLFNLTGRRCDW